MRNCPYVLVTKIDSEIMFLFFLHLIVYDRDRDGKLCQLLKPVFLLLIILFSMLTSIAVIAITRMCVVRERVSVMNVNLNQGKRRILAVQYATRHQSLYIALCGPSISSSMDNV